MKSESTSVDERANETESTMLGERTWFETWRGKRLASKLNRQQFKHAKALAELATKRERTEVEERAIEVERTKFEERAIEVERTIDPVRPF